MTVSREHSSSNRAHPPGLEEWTPGRAIDRAELVTLLLDALHGTTVSAVPLADRILALVPADGITLTREEADLAASALRTHAQSLEPMSRYRAHIAEELIDSNILAIRLEASLEPRT